MYLRRPIEDGQILRWSGPSCAIKNAITLIQIISEFLLRIGVIKVPWDEPQPCHECSGRRNEGVVEQLLVACLFSLFLLPSPPTQLCNGQIMVAGTVKVVAVGGTGRIKHDVLVDDTQGRSLRMRFEDDLEILRESFASKLL